MKNRTSKCATGLSTTHEASYLSNAGVLKVQLLRTVTDTTNIRVTSVTKNTIQLIASTFYCQF